MLTDLIIIPELRVPSSFITAELAGVYGSRVLADIQQILGYYQIYEHGAPFVSEGSNGDYIPSDLRYKDARKLINKEARFLFSKHPDIQVDVPFVNDSQAEQAKSAASDLQSYVDRVIDQNNFYLKLVKAARDCFIGKRVAYFINFNEETRKISIDFVPSTEFVYETELDDVEKLSKIVTFYTIYDAESRTQQRIYKKKYWMKDGVCWLFEAIYDGAGQLIEELTPERPTQFSYIPAGVIINDGLTGDMDGVSEIEQLAEFESWYNRMSSADIDAERQGMNPTRYAIDADPNTTKNLSIAAGSFWDLASDPNSPKEGVTAQVGVIETSMGYSSSLDSTLGRIRSAMYESVDVPDTSAEALKGVVSSGKTLKAIYWSLIVRCDEKMLTWRPAISRIVDTLIDGGKLYPLSASAYAKESLPDVEYTITVDNQYPLPEDETEEKTIDMQEVNNQVMSKLSYMKKWRGLTDDEAQLELEQIAREREMLEDSYGWSGTQQTQPGTEEE